MTGVAEQGAADVAEVLGDHAVMGVTVTQTRCLCDRVWRSNPQHSIHVAAVLRPVIDAEKATAWDEGFDAGEQDIFEHERTTYDKPCITNPYREARRPAPEAAEEGR